MALPKAGSGVVHFPLSGLQEDWARIGVVRRAAVAAKRDSEETILDM